MAGNKYIGDYRLNETFDEKGRVHVESEYIGEYYCFSGDPETVRRYRRRMAVLTVCMWAAYIASLLPDTLAMRRLWIALPYAFGALFLGLLTHTALLIGRAGQTFEHRIADRISNTWPAHCTAVVILCGSAALEAFVLALISGQITPASLFFSACAGTTALCALYLLRKRFQIDTQPAP